MGDWLDNREKNQEKAKKFGGGIRTLALKPLTKNGTPIAEDAKIASMRFLSDREAVQSVWVHSVPRLSRTGKRFTEDVYCMCQDEGKNCEYCQHTDKDIRYSRLKLFFWVYVYDIYHVLQDSDKKWVVETYLEDKYFLEPINEPMVLVTGIGRNGSTEEKFMRWGKRFGTLVDRKYDYSRTGLGLDTNYDLVPRDMDKVVEEDPVDLKHIEEVKASVNQTPKEFLVSFVQALKSEKFRESVLTEQDNDDLEDIF